MAAIVKIMELNAVHAQILSIIVHYAQPMMMQEHQLYAADVLSDSSLEIIHASPAHNSSPLVIPVMLIITPVISVMMVSIVKMVVNLAHHAQI